MPPRSKKIFISRTAQRDILDALDCLRLESPSAAGKFKAELSKKIGSLKNFPARGRRVPELRGSSLSHYLELIVGRYRVVYRELADEIRILRVLHTRRKFPKSD